MQSTVARLRALLEPTVEGLGYELVDAEYSGSGRRALLRIYIDRPGGVGLDDCATVSHQVSALLDVEDPIPGQYTLEVSSPGLDRPLIRAQDYERFAGETVKLKLHTAHAGRKKFTGRLLGLYEGKVRLEVDGEQIDLPFEGIERARLVPSFK